MKNKKRLAQFLKNQIEQYDLINTKPDGWYHLILEMLIDFEEELENEF